MVRILLALVVLLSLAAAAEAGLCGFRERHAVRERHVERGRARGGVGAVGAGCAGSMAVAPMAVGSGCTGSTAVPPGPPLVVVPPVVVVPPKK